MRAGAGRCGQVRRACAATHSTLGLGAALFLGCGLGRASWSRGFSTGVKPACCRCLSTGPGSGVCGSASSEPCMASSTAMASRISSACMSARSSSARDSKYASSAASASSAANICSHSAAARTSLCLAAAPRGVCTGISGESGSGAMTPMGFEPSSLSSSVGCRSALSAHCAPSARRSVSSPRASARAPRTLAASCSISSAPAASSLRIVSAASTSARATAFASTRASASAAFASAPARATASATACASAAFRCRLSESGTLFFLRALPSVGEASGAATCSSALAAGSRRLRSVV